MALEVAVEAERSVPDGIARRQNSNNRRTAPTLRTFVRYFATSVRLTISLSAHEIFTSN